MDYWRRLAPPAPATAPAADDRLRIATCALLLEAAHADDRLEEAERSAILEIARGGFGLAEAEAAELIALAEAERRRRTDLYGFARLLSVELDEAGRLEVLRRLWTVVYSDGRLEAHEDALMHKLATLLGLPHADLIAVKLAVKRDLRPGG